MPELRRMRRSRLFRTTAAGPPGTKGEPEARFAGLLQPHRKAPRTRAASLRLSVQGREADTTSMAAMLADAIPKQDLPAPMDSSCYRDSLTHPATDASQKCLQNIGLLLEFSQMWIPRDTVQASAFEMHNFSPGPMDPLLHRLD